MILLDDVGEWAPAVIGLGVVFLVASLGTVGLGWWVMRGEARNRRQQHLGSPEPGSGEEITHRR
ncbi:MAG: hypothetical protein ACREP9_16860 [Candidatus Dormibacteraceae bacterium]